MPAPPLPPVHGAGGPPAGGLPGAMNMPKSPVGGASGPGASPMVSPGDGAGMQAHIEQGIHSTLKTLVGYLGKIPPGTKLFKTLSRVVTDLNAAVGAPADMAGAPKMAGPVRNAPPMGMGGMPAGIPGAGGAAPPGQGAGGMPPMM